MATDCDRTARVLDKRFRRVAYLLNTAHPDALEKICSYIQFRDREADPEIGSFIRQAHRALVRSQQMPSLFSDDGESITIRERARESNAALRVGQAYLDVTRYGGDIANAYAERQVGWVEACLSAHGEWEPSRAPFAALRQALVEECAARIRAQHLEQKKISRTRRTPSRQSDILAESIPVRTL